MHMHGFQMKGLVHLALTIHKIWEDSRKFYNENLLLRKNNTNHKIEDHGNLELYRIFVVLMVVEYTTKIHKKFIIC